MPSCTSYFEEAQSILVSRVRRKRFRAASAYSVRGSVITDENYLADKPKPLPPPLTDPE